MSQDDRSVNSMPFRYALIAFVFGAIFVAIGALVGLHISQNTVSFTALINMHKQFPLVWSLDAAPFLLGLCGFVLGKRYQELAGIKDFDGGNH